MPDGVTLEGRTEAMTAEPLPCVGYARLFGEGDRKLLILAGLDFKRSFPLIAKLPGLAEGAYRIFDPVTGRMLGDREQWTAAELAAGVSVELGPGDLRTYVIQNP